MFNCDKSGLLAGPQGSYWYKGVRNVPRWTPLTRLCHITTQPSHNPLGPSLHFVFIGPHPAVLHKLPHHWPESAELTTTHKEMKSLQLGQCYKTPECDFQRSNELNQMPKHNFKQIDFQLCRRTLPDVPQMQTGRAKVSQALFHNKDGVRWSVF